MSQVSQLAKLNRNDSKPLVEGLQIVPTLYPNRPLCYSNELMHIIRIPGSHTTILALSFPPSV